MSGHVVLTLNEGFPDPVLCGQKATSETPNVSGTLAQVTSHLGSKFAFVLLSYLTACSLPLPVI